jgi:hypothetical protein
LPKSRLPKGSFFVYKAALGFWRSWLLALKPLELWQLGLTPSGRTFWQAAEKIFRRAFAFSGAEARIFLKHIRRD